MDLVFSFRAVQNQQVTHFPNCMWYWPWARVAASLRADGLWGLVTKLPSALLASALEQLCWKAPTFTKAISSKWDSCSDLLMVLCYMAPQVQPPLEARGFWYICFSWMMLICLVFNLQLIIHYSCCLPISLEFPTIVKLTFYWNMPGKYRCRSKYTGLSSKFLFAGVISRTLVCYGL